MDCSETVIIVNAVSMCSFRIHVQCNLFDSLTTDQWPKIIYTFLHRATHSVLSHRKISECVCDITDKFTFINAFNLTCPYSNTRRQVKNQIEMIYGTFQIYCFKLSSKSIIVFSICWWGKKSGLFVLRIFSLIFK